jgi:hypothetical protein
MAQEKCVTGSTKAPFWSGGRIAVVTCIVFHSPFCFPLSFFTGRLIILCLLSGLSDACNSTWYRNEKKKHINLKSSYAWELVFAFSVETTLGHGIAVIVFLEACECES